MKKFHTGGTDNELGVYLITRCAPISGRGFKSHDNAYKLFLVAPRLECWRLM